MMYTEEYLKKINKKNKFIPLTFDFAFKYIMVRNTNIFKRFLIKTLQLGINEDDVELTILDSSLWKSKKKEHGKTVDLNVKIDDNLLITIEMNRYDFNNVKIRNQLFIEKLHTLQYEVGEEYKVLKTKYITQLNLNANDNYEDKGENIVLLYDVTDKSIYNDSLKIIIKHLEYYKYLFYTDRKLMKFDEIFMAGLMSDNYEELYNIMSYILSDDELNKLMESVIDMSYDGFVLHEWAKEEMDKLVEEETRKNNERKQQKLKEMEEKVDKLKQEVEQRKQEVEQRKREVEQRKREVEQRKREVEQEKLELSKKEKDYQINIVKSMLDNNLTYEVISKVTNKSIKEIKEIENSINKQ